jgi:tetratricopeptide (TPR) repeat protein
VLSVVIAIAAAVAAFVGGWLKFGPGSGVLMALMIGPVLGILLMRRARKPLEAARVEIEKHLNARRFERAIELLDGMRRLALWQPLLTSQIDEQIGAIRYAALDDTAGARPYLERARWKGVESWAMLGASFHRRGQLDEADQVFQRATRKRPKEAFLWATYAWCRLSRGQRAGALDVLARGREKLPTDERLRRMQEAIQNGKRAHMKAFGNDWYALRLERMPTGAAPNAPSASHPAFRRRGGRTR